MESSTNFDAGWGSLKWVDFRHFEHSAAAKTMADLGGVKDLDALKAALPDLLRRHRWENTGSDRT